jgi:uncharacterized protein YbjT (DUF2867 family)
MKTQLKVLVTGATGKSGSIAIAEMIQTGASIRALVHSIDERSDKLAALGVEIVLGDMLNFDDISEAMKGIDTAYFCYPITSPGVLQATAYFAQAAKEENIKAIVNMSQISARKDAKSNAAQDHWVGERILDQTGIPTTHLRPTFFNEWFLYIHEDIQKKDTIVLPFADARWAPVASEDLGRVVAKILINPEQYKGQTITLFGPKEYNVVEMSEVLSSVVGRKITYDAVSIERFTELDAEKGAHSHFVQHVTHVAQDCIDGIFAGTNDNIETITGRKPVTLAEFFEKMKPAFQ